MSKYFIDTEFLEGTQMKRFMGMNVGNTKPTIDLISIGIVCEDDREYYAISKDFNLKEAWNRYDLKTIDYGEPYQITPKQVKDYWIRENVLKPIYKELIDKEFESDLLAYYEYPFTYSSMKYLIKKYGKSNKQIAEEIIRFVGYKDGNRWLRNSKDGNYITEITSEFNKNGIHFYGYYSDYDWTCFCWLFGKMIDLPSGFPMYCSDLKQTLDDKAYRMTWNTVVTNEQKQIDVKEWIESIKKYPNYPKQSNEHNSLSDARWNKQLYEFLNKL